MQDTSQFGPHPFGKQAPELSNSDLWPRVLAIDAATFHRRADTPMLKTNLFRGWPPDRLGQIVIGRDKPDFDVCGNYWRITRRSLVTRSGGAPVAPSGPPGLEFPQTKSGFAKSRPQFLPNVRAALGHAAWAIPLALTDSFEHWMESLAPQVIFTLAGSIGVLSAVCQISEKYHLPVVPFFTDDWIDWLHRRGPFTRILRPRLVRLFERCLDISPVRLTASASMAQEYTRRYGGRFVPCVDFVDLGKTYYEPYKPATGPVQLYFVGYLEPDRWRTLRRIGETLSVLRSEGVPAQLKIFTFPDGIAKYGSLLSLPPVMEIAGTVPPNEVPRILSRADILVHVESFGLSDKGKISFSFSTKIPQYLAAGRALLACGPEVASIRYVLSTRTGLVVTQPDPAQFLETLRRLITDVTLRTTLADRARALAIAQHDAETGRERLRELLADVAVTPRGDPHNYASA